MLFHQIYRKGSDEHNIIHYFINVAREIYGAHARHSLSDHGFTQHNDQEENKLCTMQMFVIKFGFLIFKKPNCSISGEKIRMIVAQTFLC